MLFTLCNLTLYFWGKQCSPTGCAACDNKEHELIHLLQLLYNCISLKNIFF